LLQIKQFYVLKSTVMVTRRAFENMLLKELGANFHCSRSHL